MSEYTAWLKTASLLGNPRVRYRVPKRRNVSDFFSRSSNLKKQRAWVLLRVQILYSSILCVGPVLATQVVLDKTVREILMREGVAPISAKGFYDHFANGEHGQRMYDDVNFIRGVEIVSEIDKLIAANDDSISR